MLQGIDLISCAKANANKGIIVAAKQCGYEDKLELFQENLHQACQEIGIDINELKELITDQQIAKQSKKVLDIAPDTSSDL